MVEVVVVLVSLWSVARVESLLGLVHTVWLYMIVFVDC